MKEHTLHMFAVPHPHQIPHAYPLLHMALASPTGHVSKHVHAHRHGLTHREPSSASWPGLGRREENGFYLQFEVASTWVGKVSRQGGGAEGDCLDLDKGPGGQEKAQ